MAHYRIVRDDFCGYQVDAWRWWLPIWVQVGFTNTHTSVEAAEEFAARHANSVVKYVAPPALNIHKSGER